MRSRESEPTFLHNKLTLKHRTSQLKPKHPTSKGLIREETANLEIEGAALGERLGSQARLSGTDVLCGELTATIRGDDYDGSLIWANVLSLDIKMSEEVESHGAALLGHSKARELEGQAARIFEGFGTNADFYQLDENAEVTRNTALGVAKRSENVRKRLENAKKSIIKA
ncbi:hypothetical protein MMC29_003194 [Sticta canariensis]|nr:hypothetical protein [Sticta canariensis]